MVQKIKGRTVKLHTFTETSTDPFGNPITEETIESIDNILIEPASNEAIVTELQTIGKRIAYILHIPKDDDHDWRDSVVEFYDSKWKTYGDCLQYDPELTPLSWGKKIKVERYE